MDWPELDEVDGPDPAIVFAESHQAKCETIRKSVVVYDNGLEQYARYVIFMPDQEGCLTNEKAQLISAGVPFVKTGQDGNERYHCFVSYCDFTGYFSLYLSAFLDMNFTVVSEPYSIHKKFFRGRNVNFYLFAAYLNKPNIV